MKIGLVTPLWIGTGFESGIAKNYHRLASALAARGHDVTVFYINRSRLCWRRRICWRDNGFGVVELPCRVLPLGWKMRGRGAVALAVAVVRLCWNLKRQSPPLDVVEATSYRGEAWLYDRLHWRGRAPVLVRFSTLGSQASAIEGGAENWTIASWLENSLIRSARHLCTHTLAHRDKICAVLDIDPTRVLVIPHGLDPLSPDRANAGPRQERMVLYAGRFEPRKGTDCLLAAIPKVLARHPECRFVLAGAGKMAGCSREEFQRRHGSLAENVRFLGHVTEEELEALYQRCDFFVAPALYESFGMTYLEAMRHERPVIGCRGSGSAEVIGDAGLLVSPGDADELACAIIRLWTDRELHGELAARAKIRASHFSMERKIERTERAYKDSIMAS